ncbi:hypothetical protein [Halomonas casei]|uniref:hypothetical protein n=1 Tax=Halomonas casei TaxID=2742613 RepID=UPI003CF1106F
MAPSNTVRITVQSTCRQTWCPQVGKPLTVRLSAIQEPSSRQPFSQGGIAALSGLVAGQGLTMVPDAAPKNGTFSGKVFQGEPGDNRELMAQGYAMVAPGLSATGRLYDWQAQAKRDGLELAQEASGVIDPQNLSAGVNTSNLDGLGNKADGVLSRIDRFAKGLWKEYGQPLLSGIRRHVPLLDAGSDEMTSE